MVSQCDRLAERGPGPPGGRGVCGSASALTERPRVFKIVVYVYRTIWQRSKPIVELKMRTRSFDGITLDDEKPENIRDVIWKCSQINMMGRLKVCQKCKPACWQTGVFVVVL